jgi:hypothetical protein
MNNIDRYLELKNVIAEATLELESIKQGWLAELPLGNHGRITIAKRTRIDLDKAAVLVAVGAEMYKNLEKISDYTVVTVK